MNMPKIVIPGDKAKRAQQIAALEYLLQHDTDDKSREIHRQALQDLKSGSAGKLSATL
jgi:hypothetical protein